MLNIIASGYRKILELFYSDKSRSIHLREIVKLTKLNENSAFRFLNRLEEENILRSEREGNLKKYSLRHNKAVYAFLTFLDIERSEKLTRIRKTAVSCYLKELPEQPVFAILFGSTAKSNAAKDSDIDILIITNRKIDTKKAERYADAQSAMKISTFQMTYKDFIRELKLKDDPVVQSAIFSGYPLVNHIKYYEVLDDAKV